MDQMFRHSWLPRSLCALWLTLALCLAGLAAPDASPINPGNYAGTIKVACVGDSITYGSNVSPGTDDWPTQLQGLLGSKFEVHNYGVPAQTMMRVSDDSAVSGASYWDTQAFQDATNLNPDVVIIMLGTNDSKYGSFDGTTWGDQAGYVAAYEAMIAHFATLPSHPRIWINTSPPSYSTAYGVHPDVIQNVIVSLVKDQISTGANVPVIDVNPTLTNQPVYFPDDVHPNRAGHTRIAQIVHAALTGAPLISPLGGLFLNSQAVTLTPTVTGAQSYYTVDGSTPTTASPLYSSPFSITGSTRVTALAVGTGISPALPALTNFDFTLTTLSSPSQPGTTVQGLDYKYYQGNYTDAQFNDPSSLTPTETGSVTAISNLPHVGTAQSCYLLTGYLNVPQDGIFTFSVGCYDTGILTIDGTLVAESGGYKGYSLTGPTTGQVALAAGLHSVSVLYSQQHAGLDGTPSGVFLRYFGPGVTLQGIPDTAFVRVGSIPVPSAPTGLAATAGNAQIALTWNTVSGATSYNVYRGTSAGGESTTAIKTGLTSASYTNTGLTNGTKYY